MTATCNQAKDAPHEIAVILVHDTLMTGNMQFAKAEERMHSNYDIGQTRTITNGSQIKFGGCRSVKIPMVQCAHPNKLTLKTCQISRQICITI
jgi:hypothetical protein